MAKCIDLPSYVITASRDADEWKVKLLVCLITSLSVNVYVIISDHTNQHFGTG